MTRSPAEKPWLDSYADGVPRELEVPPGTLGDLIAESVATYPRGVALEFFGRETSYAELGEQIDHAAEGLRRLGVKPGDRVALILPNCPQHVVAFYAVLRLGASRLGLLLGPAVLLALAGLVSLLRSPKERAFREVAWACLGAFVVLLLLHGKAYYIGPIYPTLFAAGAAWLERRTARHVAPIGNPPRYDSAPLGMARIVAVAFVVGYGLLTLPFGLPVLPPVEMARYARAMGVKSAVTTNVGVVQRLPQDYADMLGWEQRVAAVARVFHALPPEDQARAVIITSNYGEAGAIDFYGPRYGLPRAIATEGTYWYFGPGDKPGEVAVALDDDREGLDHFFGSVTPMLRLSNDWTVPEEQRLTIYVCRKPRTTLQQAWPGLAVERSS